MKKILMLLMVLISTISFSEYNFPLKNPYVATILGSSKIMTEGVPTKIPMKEYTLDLAYDDEIPENLWYENGFKFSFSKQKGEAPLIFVLAGTGSKYNSTRTENFQKIFYGAGYHVITVTSVFNANFLLNASNTKVPGILLQDGVDLYKAMEEMLAAVIEKENPKITSINLMGYSMGGTHSAILSYLDTKFETFNFEKVYMVNPSVNLYYSSAALDNMLAKNLGSKKNIEIVINGMLDKLKNNMSGMDLEISEETIYSLFATNSLSDEDMQILIGAAFNLTSVDLNYIVDLVKGMKVYSQEQPEKFESMYQHFKAVNFASFRDYLEKLAYPYYKNLIGGDIKFDEIVELAHLGVIKDYLKNADNIVVVTNEDDFILSEDDKKFIKDVFGDRSYIYEFGGHCGNMFYQENVDRMLKYFKEGEF